MNMCLMLRANRFNTPLSQLCMKRPSSSLKKFSFFHILVHFTFHRVKIRFFPCCALSSQKIRERKKKMQTAAMNAPLCFSSYVQIITPRKGPDFIPDAACYAPLHRLVNAFLLFGSMVGSSNHKQKITIAVIKVYGYNLSGALQ